MRHEKKLASLIVCVGGMLYWGSGCQVSVVPAVSRSSHVMKCGSVE